MTYEPPEDYFADESEEDLAAMAATQKALDEERAEIDAAASEAPIAEVELDEHDMERLELGFGLAWWRDESLLDGLGAITSVVEQAVETSLYAKEYRDHGLPAEVLARQFTVDPITGPLLMCGLQILGIFAPELRELIRDALKSFEAPVPTEDEQKQLDEVAEIVFAAREEAARKSLEAQGFRIVTPEELAQMAERAGEDEQPFEGPSLN
jgi:hypothetical protein